MSKRKTRGNRKTQKQLSKEFRGRTYCMRDMLSSLYECIGLDKFPCKEKPIEPKEPKKPRKQRESKRQNDVSTYNADVERYNKELNEYHIEMEKHKIEMIEYNKWLDEHVKAYVDEFLLQFKCKDKSDYCSDFNQSNNDSAYSSASSLPNIETFQQQHQYSNYSAPLYMNTNQQEYVPSQPPSSSYSQSFEQQSNSAAYQGETNNWSLGDIFSFDDTYFSDNNWISNQPAYLNQIPQQGPIHYPHYYADSNNYSTVVSHQQHFNENPEVLQQSYLSTNTNNLIRQQHCQEGPETLNQPATRKRNPTEGLTNDLRDRAIAGRLQEPTSQVRRSYKKRASGSEWYR